MKKEFEEFSVKTASEISLAQAEFQEANKESYESYRESIHIQRRRRSESVVSIKKINSKINETCSSFSS